MRLWHLSLCEKLYGQDSSEEIASDLIYLIIKETKY